MQATLEKIGRHQVAINEGTNSKGEQRWDVQVATNGRPSWRLSHRFPSLAIAESYVQQLRNQQAKKDVARAAKLKANRDARETFVNPFKVGDILNYSWGYDQTNQEFAQIVEVGPRSVVMREIKCKTVPDRGCGPMSGTVSPLRDQFTDSEPFRKTVQVYVERDGKVYHTITADHGIWSPVGERENFYVSWYA